MTKPWTSLSCQVKRKITFPDNFFLILQSKGVFDIQYLMKNFIIHLNLSLNNCLATPAATPSLSLVIPEVNSEASTIHQKSCGVSIL